MSGDAFEMLVDQTLGELPARAAAVSLQVPGVSLVRCKGRLPSGTSVTPATPMYAASLTKQLVAALVVQAIEERLLAYEAYVVDLVPLPAWARLIRIRHLLHHTSGLPEVTAPFCAVAVDNDEVLRRIRAAAGPVAPPGETFSYCNTGYVILAVALEHAFAQSVAELARERIFTPLAMNHASLRGTPVIELAYPDPPGTIGDGGWWTSAADLGIWLHALNSDPYWSAIGCRMEQPGSLDSGEPLEYAWGVRVTTRQGRRTVTHGGGWPGWLSKTVRQPDQQIAVALLARADDEFAVSEAALGLADHL